MWPGRDKSRKLFISSWFIDEGKRTSGVARLEGGRDERELDIVDGDIVVVDGIVVDMGT